MANFYENRGVKRKFTDLPEKPREVSIINYAQSRASEIEALAADLKTRTGNKLVFQFLPRNLRRRAMSHNIKRLPRRLHGMAKPEFENRTKTSKCPSRKHRRRPKNLLQEYNRRQRKQVWLETHIWHAKRFKMEDKWGYKVPLHSTDKSVRASYRAAQNHCQIQDISYMCCIEINGEESAILEGLFHITSSKTGLTFGAKSNLSGTREGTTMVYMYDRYPYNAIGCIQYLWKPFSNQNSRRQMWIWCHPSCYKELWEQLHLCFKSDSSKVVTDKGTLETEMVSSGEITVTSLKDTLNRHRLTGPAANQIIYEVFHPANILKTEAKSLWWQKYYQDPSSSLAYTQQGEYMESLSKIVSPGEYPPHSVIGITVRDPRLFRPEKRTKVTQNIKNVDSDTTICSEKLVPDISLSALWSSDIREEVKTTKVSDQKINELKSDIVIPGDLADLGIEESRIPVILIQRPGVRQGTSMNYGCGWDVILPGNWSMAFWVACIYRGARAVGSRELYSLALEQKTAYFPNDYPDSAAGQSNEKISEEKLKSKYDKRPPAKRCNYDKLGIDSPFSYPWLALIKSWNTDSDNMYVLRDKKALKTISQMIKDTEVKGKKLSNSKAGNYLNANEVFCVHKQSLVHVEIAMTSRGVPDEHAIICIPTTEDIEMYERDKTYSGPKESVHKQLKNDKSQEKQNTKSTSEDKTSSSESKDIRNSCSREVIGFVNHGGFTYLSGNGHGLGFCSLTGLQKVLQSGKSVILVRNPTSYQYRLAQISVIL